MKEELRKLLDGIWNVPNVLTMLRLALVPLFAAVYGSGRPHLALLIFCLASLTDFFDGLIARRCHLITSFGKLMDPLADKLMVCTALICLATSQVFPWVAFAVVAVKEIIMIAGSAYMLKHGIVVHSNMYGKSAQVSFILAMVLGFFHDDFVALGMPVDQAVLWIAVILALIALVDYTLMSLRQLREKT